MSSAILPRILLCLLLLSLATPAVAADFMFQATVDGETVEGRPLAWTDYVMHLLGRDGRHHTFDPKEAKNAKKTSPQFYGYTVPEVRRLLQKEFGDSMQITTTKHYVVAHPPGASGKWASHFEELYRSFLAYFRVRGFQLEEPKFPLVAIVYANEGEFQRAMAKQDAQMSNILGYYFFRSNRVEMYDFLADHPNADWSANADTVIHEATHQTACNVGIQNRFAPPPQWLMEGLATMFEARGVWNSQSYHSLKDRVNMTRYRDFQAGLKNRKPGTFGNLIASDRMFETDMSQAYAEAWAMTLFLCETRPRELAAYLQKTASRPEFTNYFASQRVKDFAECFGSDFKQLEANFLNWMKQLKSTVGSAESGVG
jgi:hypothetical protein